jgi:hypothetical protein
MSLASTAFISIYPIATQARSSSLEEVLQLCADRGVQEHNMKGFGCELYMKMRSCVKNLEEGASGPTS